ncbi:Mannosyl-oligosaccharide glucosidase GCS1-like protein [Drosera capensis]
MPASTRRTARTKPKPSTDESDHNHPATNPNSNRRPPIDQSRNRSFINLKSIAAIMIAVSAISILLLLFLFYRDSREEIIGGGDERPRVVTPFPAPKVTDLPQFQGEHKESLYWGTYRPLVYLGIRARTPQSLLAGLIWIGVKDGRFHLRHVCQDSDQLKTYGWTHHNGRDYGQQLLIDQNLILETSFLKSKEEDSGYGGDWAVRIDAKSTGSIPDDEGSSHGHLFFYVGDEAGNAISLSKDDVTLHGSSLLAFGSRADVADWQLHLKSKEDLEIHYCGFRTPHFHNLSELVQADLADQIRRFGRLQLSNSYEASSNVLVFQFTGKLPLKADVAFVSGTNLKSPRVEERIGSLTGESLDGKLFEKKDEFDNKFRRCFDLAEEHGSEALAVGKAALGNLLGGIGYFYGQSKISLPKTPHSIGDDYLLYWPAELYTAVPSRSYFPRGFLWDEGFHQLLIWRWDVHLSMDIIAHWLDLMNIDGWIPREQILGGEALSKVPAQFVLQHPTNGNPPSLFLVLHDLVSSMKRNKFTVSENNEISSFLDQAFVRLDAWFKWFNTSQSGKIANSYFWHGRDNSTVRELNPKTLSSGLDDYPRASHPNDDERHLDLRCWMLLAANCMHSITEVLKDPNLGQEYGSTAKLLSDFEVLNQMHFDETYGAYFDFGNHTEKVRLSWQAKSVGQNVQKELVREVLEVPELRLVPHVGYVSLFPFIGKIIPPDSWILEKQLDLISNSSVLWSKYGIRSLAKTSTMYMKRNTEHDPPYWRGPIWINMNYMILSSLHHYSSVDGPYKARAKAIYDDLRHNLIRNVVSNYHKTGYLWEQYDQKAGWGKGTRPFTGWTSLVLLIMAEAYGDGWGMVISHL